MMTAMAKTTMKQDFALLKGQELISLRGISQKTFDLGKGRRQAGDQLWRACTLLLCRETNRYRQQTYSG